MWRYEAPALWPAFLYGMGAIIGLAISDGAGGSQVLLLVGGGLAFLGTVLGVVTVLVFLGRWGSDILDDATRAMARTKQSMAAEAVRGLTADQLQAVRLTGEIGVGVKMAPAGPRYLVSGTAVPLDFLAFEYLPLCMMDQDGVTHTAPIGSWSDGRTWKDAGQCRTLAREFTQHLVQNGLAVWGAGNQSARLTGELTVLDLRRMLGLAKLDQQLQEGDQ